MSAHRLPDDQHREMPRSERGRDDVLRLVRQRMSQNARIVRLGERMRRAIGIREPGVGSERAPSDERN